MSGISFEIGHYWIIKQKTSSIPILHDQTVTWEMEGIQLNMINTGDYLDFAGVVSFTDSGIYSPDWIARLIGSR